MSDSFIVPPDFTLQTPKRSWEYVAGFINKNALPIALVLPTMGFLVANQSLPDPSLKNIVHLGLLLPALANLLVGGQGLGRLPNTFAEAPKRYTAMFAITLSMGVLYNDIMARTKSMDSQPIKVESGQVYTPK